VALGGGRSALIVDANVLIDYCDTDISILGLASQQGPVYVASPVLAEVDGLDEDECERLGLRLVRPSAQQLVEAGRGSTALAFQDKLCLAIAEEKGLTAVTNDKRLRSECATRGIPVKWGLEIMLDLVEAGQLARDDAVAVAEAIREGNPYFITNAIVDEFRKRASRAARKGSGG
jgi:rRNA-processing protein FCF1